MALNLTIFVIITFTMVGENLENSPLRMHQNGPQSDNLSIVIITFTMVEENFENPALKTH